jgi:prepilin-type N-terminal cleavage/methylation domain-containing protein/prepilin-type processing-associated H-X9-DG protein
MRLKSVWIEVQVITLSALNSFVVNPGNEITMQRRILSNRRKAFTLIELLVVMAIISILASIIFPSFTTAREKARQIACTSNIRQLGLAVFMYTEDNDERLPNASHGDTGNAQGGWVYYDSFVGGSSSAHTVFDVTKGALYSYLKNKQIYQCPDDSVVGNSSGLSYSINSCTQGKDAITGVGLTTGDQLSIFKSETDTALFCEEGSSLDAHGSTDDGYYYVNGGDVLSNRHSSGSVFVFVDGHAKWYNALSGPIASSSIYNGGDTTLNCSPF